MCRLAQTLGLMKTIARRRSPTNHRKRSSAAWRSYELVAKDLLNRWARDFGISHVDGKRAALGTRSRTSWELDARATIEGDQAFLIVEVRRYPKRRLTKGAIGELAYRILDTGAAGGIVVSPLGLQTGAQRVASAENILSVRLSENSTNEDYITRFLNRVLVGLQPECLSVSCTLVGGSLVTVSPSRNEA